MKISSDHANALYELFVKIDNVEDCKAFLEDLCTYKEVDQMAQRAYAAKLLLSGETYSEIIAKTDISSATLSRVSRALTHGSGGYSKIIGENKNEP